MIRRVQRKLSRARARLNRVARHKALRLRCAVCGAEWLATADKAPCQHGYRHQVAGFTK